MGRKKAFDVFAPGHLLEVLHGLSFVDRGEESLACFGGSRGRS